MVSRVRKAIQHHETAARYHENMLVPGDILSEIQPGDFRLGTGLKTDSAESYCHLPVGVCENF